MTNSPIKALLVPSLRKARLGRFLLRRAVMHRNRGLLGSRVNPFARLSAKDCVKDLPAYIQEALVEYTRSVSSADQATSLECAAILWRLASILDAHTVVDLGSGFSSYLLRCWARDRRSVVRVISADDDPVWLERTRLYLRSKRLPTEHLYAWEDLKNVLTCYQPDLIFHDLGRMPTRTATLPTILDSMHEDTWVVLDDVHKHRYRSIVVEELGKRGLFAYDLTNPSFDAFGRHAWLVGRNPWRRSIEG